MTEYTFLPKISKNRSALGWCDTETDVINLNMENLVTSCMMECGPIQKYPPKTEAFENLFMDECIHIFNHEHLHLALVHESIEACLAYDKIVFALELVETDFELARQILTNQQELKEASE